MTTERKYAVVQYRPSERLDAELTKRLDGIYSASGIAKRDLWRYYDVLGAELRGIDLSEAEWNFLRDLANGTLWDGTSARFLWAEADDADPELDAKWDVNRAQLVARLRALTPGQSWAVVDQLEQFWAETRSARLG